MYPSATGSSHAMTRLYLRETRANHDVKEQTPARPDRLELIRDGSKVDTVNPVSVMTCQPVTLPRQDPTGGRVGARATLVSKRNSGFWNRNAMHYQNFSKFFGKLQGMQNAMKNVPGMGFAGCCRICRISLRSPRIPGQGSPLF